MDNDPTLSRLENKVLTITLNRPDKKNAVSEAMYSQLISLLAQADANEDVHIVLIHGAGEAFCAGADYADFSDPLGRTRAHPAVDFVSTLIRFRKPIIAAVHGVAIGVGATMLLHCDIVLAAEETQFRFPFVELGLVPEVAATKILPATIGYFRAARILFEAEFLDVSQMAEIGIVTEIAPPTELMTRAKALAEKLSRKSNLALQRTKFLLRPPADELEERAMAEFGEIAHIVSDKEKFSSGFRTYSDKVRSKS